MHRPADHYLQPYRDAIETHGPCFLATLWMSREAQQLRFDVLIDMIGAAELENAVILDAGCALGDLAARLLERHVPFKQYVGIDALPQPIETARKRQLPNCEFHTADVLHDPKVLEIHKPDFVVISGTLNTMEESQARSLVHQAFDSSQRGVAFNFLSDRATNEWLDRDIGPSKRFQTSQWLDWALSRTPLVAFRHDYFEGHDASIVMWK